MTGTSKSRLTFKRIRFALFLRSYAFYRIAIELRKKYSGKKVIPEISRLSCILSLPYKPLWRAIILEKFQPLSRRILNKDKIKIYLAIENELILLAITRNNKSYFIDSDYDEEYALLSLAIERAAGNALKDIGDDHVFKERVKELERKYHYWYYKIAYKYKLPTTRIVPFLLRLIG